MLVSQIIDESGALRVVARDGAEARVVNGNDSLYSLACEAAATGSKLQDLINARGFGAVVDLEAVYAAGKMLPPMTHPDPAHLYLTGTGLTHLGSASTRDAMHQKTSATEHVTDTMKIFRMGVEGGKSKGDQCGVQPEWFYKGNGTQLANPGAALVSPSFADDGGEEPEMAGVYIIAEDGTPFRVGFALANEFSDHVMERVNYLYLAHSKLRQSSFGPEIRLGDLPKDVVGSSRILRDGKVVFDKPFLSGEANMSHSIDNLEHHHFKYDLFRQPGDVHVHMFGTATLSFAEGFKAKTGDVFEIEVPEFGLPLRNPLKQEDVSQRDKLVRVKTL